MLVDDDRRCGSFRALRQLDLPRGEHFGFSLHREAADLALERRGLRRLRTDRMMDETLESSALQSLLAHRFPFLLVDRVRILDPGRRVLGTKRVSAGEWWCNSEMPAACAMPFGLVIEALAQTTSALMLELTEGAPGALAYFMGADRVRFRHAAYPGDELALAVTLVQWRRGVCRARAVATVDGDLVARALLTTVVRAAH